MTIFNKKKSYSKLQAIKLLSKLSKRYYKDEMFCVQQYEFYRFHPIEFLCAISNGIHLAWPLLKTAGKTCACCTAALSASISYFMNSVGLPSLLSALRFLNPSVCI